MDEIKAREIANANDLSLYTRQECAECDQWIKEYALKQLRKYLKGNANAVIRQYVMLCANAHYGSAETDTMLMAMGCYPDWLEGTRQ